MVGREEQKDTLSAALEHLGTCTVITVTNDTALGEDRSIPWEWFCLLIFPDRLESYYANWKYLESQGAVNESRLTVCLCNTWGWSQRGKLRHGGIEACCCDLAGLWIRSETSKLPFVHHLRTTCSAHLKVRNSLNFSCSSFFNKKEKIESSKRPAAIDEKLKIKSCSGID